MKRRVVKKQMRRLLNSELPSMFRYPVMLILIMSSSKYGLYQFKPYTYKKSTRLLMITRFSTSLHKGCVTVSEHGRIDEIGFSSWHKALTWICKQAQSKAKVSGVKYIVNSGHFRYRVWL